MANQIPENYYSYSKLEKFRRWERKFRSIQAILLLSMVVVFIFYMITFGLDVAKFLDDWQLLAAALTIVVIAMIFLIIGIRGVAFESCCMVSTFAFVFFFVTIAHGLTFLFRHPGLTAVNFVLALLLFLMALIYLCFLCRMNRYKPDDYGVTAEIRSEDTESSVALTTEQQNADYDSKRGFGINVSGRPDVEKVITNVKSQFSDLGSGLADNADRELIRVKREVKSVKSGLEDEIEAVKRDFTNLQAGVPEAMEKEFVAVKRVLLNEAQKGLGDIQEGVERVGDTVQREYTVVRKNITGDVDRLIGDVKGKYGELVDKELAGSFKSGLGDIEKEFNIFQKEFGGTGDGTVQRVVSSVRKGYEEFKSGGENVKREIVEVKRDEHGNITSYIERRLTDSGVEISSVTVDKGKAPIANFQT